jgi:SAM-dependent methyltransferase
MIYRRRVIPPRLVALWGLSPRLAEALARKESSDCAHCGAKLRARRLARVLLEVYPLGTPAAPARSLAEWTQSPQARGLRVAEINRIEGVHDQLLGLPGFQWSDYEPGMESGQIVRGVRSENLTHLSYANESFDLVLTSETLEHVPDLAAAFKEIHRVLVAGGHHLCTVPMLPGVGKTYPRTIVRPDGTLQEVAPRICHPGGDVGYPVFTEFGADLPELVESVGFTVSVRFSPPTDDDLGQVQVWKKL